jgi:hypothetical protein
VVESTQGQGHATEAGTTKTAEGPAAWQTTASGGGANAAAALGATAKGGRPRRS